MKYYVKNSVNKIIKSFTDYKSASNYYDTHKKRGWYVHWQPNQ